MTQRCFDLVYEISITTGVASYSLGGAKDATYQSASAAGYVNGDTGFFCAKDLANGGWEVFLGTWLTGPTLARTTILASSNAGAAVSWSSGSREVYQCVPAAQINAFSKNGPFRNIIINGDHSLDPNAGGAVTVAAGAALVPAVEMFYMACTGANVTFQQITGADSRKRSRFTGAASNTSVIFGTRIEAKNSMELAGIVATLSGKFSSSSLTTIGWATYYAAATDSFGTLASPTRTSIASGNFTIGSTESVSSVQTLAPSLAVTGIEIVFTSGALAAGNTLTFGDNQLEPGSISAAAITFEKVETNQQQTRTLSYYQRRASSEMRGYNTGGSIVTMALTHLFPMRAVPAPAVLFPPGYNNSSGYSLSSVNSYGYSQSVTVTASGTGYCDAAGTIEFNARLF